MADLGSRRETTRLGVAPRVASRASRGAAAVTIALVMSLGALVANGSAAVPAGGRSWELVSFGQPSSARSFGVRPMGESGDQFVYSTAGPAPGSESGSFLSYTVAARGSTGWNITPIGFPYSIFTNELLAAIIPLYPAAFSEDFGTALWLSFVPLSPAGPPEGELGLYRKDTGEPAEFIANLGESIPLFYEGFADIAGDGGRVVFASVEHLLPADAGRSEGASIYTWDGGGLQLVDVANDGSLLSTCGSTISQMNGMSADASLAFFTVPATCGGLEKVYVRDLDADETTEISASQCTRVDCDAEQGVTFAGATHNGRFAFLTSTQQLTNDDHDTARDLYRYDVAKHELLLLSNGSLEATGEVLQENVFPSDDGTRVYFRATGRLKPGELTGGEKLFMAGPGELKLVAPATFPNKPQIQPSADGERALFTTQTQVLASDTDFESDAYLYDAEGESITRISSGPEGGNGPFEAHIESPIGRPEFELGDRRPFYALDANGERAFFWTSEKLLPEDINGKADIYEWWNGQLGLISPGNDGTDSAFAGASRDGRTVVFATNATLNPADQDGGNRDFYVARLEGFPPAQKAPQAQSCDASSCPFPLRNQLSRPSPGSAKPARGKRAKIRVLGIRSSQSGLIGRSTAVLASVPSPGLVTAQVWDREGGKKAVIATGSAGAIRAGKIRLNLSLTRLGRHLGTGIARGLLTIEEGDFRVAKVVKVDLGQ